MLIFPFSGWSELEAVSPVVTIGLFLVPATRLPAVPLEAVADPTAKVVPPWRMVIVPALALLALPPVSVAMAEMLQGASEQSLFSSLVFVFDLSFGVVKVPVARKLPPAVMAIVPPFLPSALIEVTWMLLRALRVTVPPSLSVDVASMDSV